MGEKQNLAPVIMGIVLVGMVALGVVALGGKKGNNVTTTIEVPTPSVSVTSPIAIDLVVLSPANNAVVGNAKLEVRGKTAPGAEVTVNEFDVVANQTGAFTVDLTLEEGENVIVIVANNENGDFVEKELTVTYEP